MMGHSQVPIINKFTIAVRDGLIQGAQTFPLQTECTYIKKN